ncbi:MAG: hypothetical protein OXH58_08385 [Acidimicrobiaceae bacterium]|nr:hypothetical protein [Acidimicrobiaceae bacterium]
MIHRWMRADAGVWLLVAAALTVAAIISPSPAWWFLACLCMVGAVGWPFIRNH